MHKLVLLRNFPSSQNILLDRNSGLDGAMITLSKIISLNTNAATPKIIIARADRNICHLNSSK
jgi:hypothetical protein